MSVLLNYLLILLGAFVEFVFGGAAALRSPRWTLDWLSWLERLAGRQRWWHGWIAVALIVALPPLAIAVALVLLAAISDVLAYAFGLGVLVLMLGPEDLAAEVDRHKRAVTADPFDGPAGAPPIYIRHAAPVDLGPPTGDPEFDDARGELAALALAAEHAWFQPVFWFLIGGPVGVVLYRLCANLRRSERLSGELAEKIASVRETLEFLPARVTVIALGVAGTLVPVLDCARVSGWMTWGASATLVARSALAATDNGRIRDVIGGAAQVYRINQMHALLRRTMIVWLVAAAGLALAMA